MRFLAGSNFPLNYPWWGTANAKIMALSGRNLLLSKSPSCKHGVNQTFPASDTVRNCAFLLVVGQIFCASDTVRNCAFLIVLGQTFRASDTVRNCAFLIVVGQTFCASDTDRNCAFLIVVSQSFRASDTDRNSASLILPSRVIQPRLFSALLKRTVTRGMGNK